MIQYFLSTWLHDLFTNSIEIITLSKNDRMNINNNLKSELSRLNQELIFYRIVDRQGRYRGEVRDIYYDANDELNLLIELREIDNKINLRRLGYQDICQIDLDNKLILSNLSYQQLQKLPLYQSILTDKHLKDGLIESPLYNDCEMNKAPNNNNEQSTASEIYQIPLLEEKLQVSRSKRKIGEVIIRKQVETRMIKVPIRREKLIVERIGKNPERLTEVVITEEKVNGFKYQELKDNDSLHITKSSFLAPQTAQKLLEAIAHLSSTANTKVRLEIVTNCSEHQIEHQDICERYISFDLF